jgi:hypothetical protein
MSPWKKALGSSNKDVLSESPLLIERRQILNPQHNKVSMSKGQKRPTDFVNLDFTRKDELEKKNKNKNRIPQCDPKKATSGRKAISDWRCGSIGRAPSL